jgi:hypothetical protein
LVTPGEQDMLSRELRAKIGIRVEGFFSGCDWRLRVKMRNLILLFKRIAAWDIH